MTKQGSQRLVLFDVDGTLIPRPGCEPRFARYLLRRGRLGPRQILGFLYFWVRYLPAYGRHIPQKNKAWLAGLRVTQVRDWAVAFVRDVLLPVGYQPALERLREHVDAGDHVVLLSGTPDFIVNALADQLGVAGAYGSICATRNGRFRAVPPVRHPYGPTKVTAAREIAEAAGLPLAQAIAYGDSINDAHVFRVVGHSVAVMPDRRLRAAAGGEDWEILTGG